MSTGNGDQGRPDGDSKVASSDYLSPKTTLVPGDSQVPILEPLHTACSLHGSVTSMTDFESSWHGHYHNKDKITVFRDKTHERYNSESTDSETELDEDEEQFPEGGVRAWIVTFACFCGLIACFGLLNATGVMENYLQSHQLKDQSSSSIGWIFSLLLFICFASCIFSGTYFDRNGIRNPLIVGTVLHVGGLFGMASSTKLWHFILSFSVLCGFGNGIVLSPLVSCPAHYFKKKRGTASALATVGGSVGGGLFPLMLRKFFSMESETDPNYGFVWGIRTLAFVNLALLTIAIFLARERISRIDDEPKRKESKLRYVLRVYLLESFDAKAFKDMKYLTCVIGTCVAELSLCSVITYYSAYSISRGVSQSDSYMLIMVINLTGIPGRWVPGVLSDYFGRFNVAIATLTLLGLVMFIAWLPFGTNLTNMYVISALYGFFSGSTFSLLPVCCGQISKTEEFGRRYSTMYFCVAFATLVGVPITGAIIGDKSQANYQHYKIFCGVTVLFSAACFVVSRFFAVGWRWKKF
ncbi:riboflavin transporter KNAG_0G03160 [Huiozyma naganishii CBS 8797]|uniref:Major facilitator superfamily (MFS) profile domain-containing protein n=1 Tax=Huiozyma naganishii (strain ATCC MYA-139 / BCRC 22969 / CBS 8797 / KCTC 17520 / NBRC 10181 / NCYC 3082 / Yp74L-3) TaxID=1071383 RepID=J7RNZ9_HUIN7|nr:hypothetical protein KNAG_0G03160 [Kazachstania naganishii CBS 8797]CCK71373.1 hypothetical protein KNAG_0G03160 [Kazachstania naganishii CBS 8797]